jgi:hypothetical protein
VVWCLHPERAVDRAAAAGFCRHDMYVVQTSLVYRMIGWIQTDQRGYADGWMDGWMGTD